MTVLMTADTVGGVWTYALDLARALGQNGVRVVLATMGAPPTPEQWREARRVSTLTVVDSSYRLEWMPDPWDDVDASGRWLLELDRRVRPDVVHLNGYAHGALPFSAPVLITAHSCVLSWWQAVKGQEAPASWQRYRDTVLGGLAHASLIVAPTSAMADCIERFYAPPTRVHVIPNGRDASLYTAGPKSELVLSAGRLWDEGKNVASVTAAAARMPWPVYVAGDTDGADLQGVKCLGRLSSVSLAGWYSRAAIYALPARYEPFGLSALEAALSGCALVLGDIPSLREVWGPAAIFVHPDDVEGLARAVTSLAEDAARLREMAARAMTRATHYNMGRTADTYLSLYKELSGAPTAAPGGLHACVS